MSETLILGTAMWGWTMDRATCFELLDLFYAAGGREVDGATNYPINKDPGAFRLAEKILLEWIDAHQVTDLKVMMKLGSINNMRTPECNLSKSFLLFGLEEYQNTFGENLDTIMIHWDNRDELDQIKETVAALAVARATGYRIGWSGLRCPDQYAEALAENPMPIRIQLKHNILQSAYSHYEAFHGKAQFIAYGINAGGLKLDTDHYRKDGSLKARGGDKESAAAIVSDLQRIVKQAAEKQGNPSPLSMNHLAMIYALQYPGIDQILIGPSRKEQLADCLNWAENIAAYDYSDVFSSLKDLTDAA